MSTSHRWSFLASFGFAAAVAAACAAPPAGPGGATSESANTEANDLEVLFSPAYSAYDGEHEFKIPLIVEGVRSPDWSASDDSMVDLDPGSSGSVMVTVRKAGKVTITAKKGPLAGSTELNITEADAEEWEAGNQRYNNGIVLKRGRRDGGERSEEAKQAACTNCHGPGSNDVEHTPMQTGGYTDQQIIDIFTKAKKPPGVEQRIMPLDRWQKIHMWSMDELAVKGLVVYLRSLEPKSQGPVDWGGRGGKGDRDGGRRDGGDR